MWIVVQVLVGLFLGYLSASLAESFLHRNILHASSRVRKYWKRHPVLFAPFLRAYYCHHVVHHGMTFKKDFVTQFRNEREKNALDARLPARWAALLRREKYGLTLRGSGVLMFLLPVIPFLPTIYFSCGLLVAAAAAVPLLILYPVMSMVFHPLLHLTHEAACSRTSRVVAMLLRTPYMRAVVQNHYLHHRYVDSNYNLLLGGDFLLGLHRPVGPEDIREMATLGVLAKRA
jgi:hypothetical protein